MDNHRLFFSQNHIVCPYGLNSGFSFGSQGGGGGGGGLLVSLLMVVSLFPPPFPPPLSQSSLHAQMMRVAINGITNSFRMFDKDVVGLFAIVDLLGYSVIKKSG